MDLRATLWRLLCRGWLRGWIAVYSMSSYTDGAQLAFLLGTRGGSTARGQRVPRADSRVLTIVAPVLLGAAPNAAGTPTLRARDSAHSGSASSSHRVWPPARSSGRHRGSARFTSCAAWGASNARGLAGVFVSEEAAIDEPYNIRLHSTHGVRSRAPRVPALWCIVTPRGASEPNR
jgi:hypothetical protein